MSFQRLGAGTQMLPADLDGDDRIAADLKHLFGVAGSVAEAEPFAIRPDSALEQPHAKVSQMQFARAVLVDLDLAQVDLARLDLQLWCFQRSRRQLGEQLIEPAVDVRKLGGFLSGHRQIDAPHAAEERTQIALPQEVDRGRPVVLAGYRELIEVAAGQSVGKDELIRKWRSPGIDRFAGPARQSDPITRTNMR